MLPADIREGDYVEIGMLGAYRRRMGTRFNGFGETETVSRAGRALAVDVRRRAGGSRRRVGADCENPRLFAWNRAARQATQQKRLTRIATKQRRDGLAHEAIPRLRLSPL